MHHCEKMDTEHVHLLSYIETSWLSKDRSLGTVFESIDNAEISFKKVTTDSTFLEKNDNCAVRLRMNCAGCIQSQTWIMGAKINIGILTCFKHWQRFLKETMPGLSFYQLVMISYRSFQRVWALPPIHKRTPLTRKERIPNTFVNKLSESTWC